ncbi:hypothetical protein B6S44_16630 [Bosea sp. Tri-44]|uniref:hypothetical protein n=1 Tax=Bosea sp. Tri-44 TaxID=1972137 RepID=UPI00100F4BF4|nr:hypothetical protein [Bosea sp. Tri-44]RXT52407.1 hypothetical protein B6S44_16630 [Bosea sp. Tri-44]
MMTSWKQTMVALAALLFVHPALAQIGTPGNAPLTPGGPRQGLGPPSIFDHTPDIRLHAPGAGGLPGAGPPVDYGGTPRTAPRSQNPIYMPRYGPVDDPSPRGVLVAYCKTPRRTCAAPSRAIAGARCFCRLPNGARLRGRVVR